jgi:hypothetical protein
LMGVGYGPTRGLASWAWDTALVSRASTYCLAAVRQMSARERNIWSSVAAQTRSRWGISRQRMTVRESPAICKYYGVRRNRLVVHCISGKAQSEHSMSALPLHADMHALTSIRL